MRARACIVAPAEVSAEIVRPFGAPGHGEGKAGGGDDDAIICCNLSEGPARVALRGSSPDGGSPSTTRPAESQGQSPPERTQAERTEAASDSMTDSIALALEMGECLVALRRSILGYIPDEQGEPTLWFECLLQNKSSGARLP